MSGKDPLIDLVSGKNMTAQQSLGTATDRLGRAHAALLFNAAFATLPPGAYFDLASGGFTLVLWLRLLSLDGDQAILAFADGWRLDAVCLRFEAARKRLKAGVGGCLVESAEMTGGWTQVAVVVGPTQAAGYLNGSLQRREAAGRCGLRGVARTGSIGGKTLWAELGGMRIFGRALSVSELRKEIGGGGLGENTGFYARLLGLDIGN